MKTQNQKTIELIEKNDEKSIFNSIRYWVSNRDKHDNLIGDTFMDLIAEHSNDSGLRIIAGHCVNTDANPSNADAALLTSEILNNKDQYLSLINDMANQGRSDAFDVLKEIYPDKSDAEIQSMIA